MAHLPGGFAAEPSAQDHLRQRRSLDFGAAQPGLGMYGVLGLVSIWRTVAVVSACVSMLLVVLFWKSWLVVGFLLDIGILIALMAEWPSQSVIGS